MYQLYFCRFVETYNIGMKHIYRCLHIIAVILLPVLSNTVFAQCSTSSEPSYPLSCTSQYFTSISASGTGVVSTISYSYSSTGSSCPGTYFNYFSSQGITANAGTTVTFSISRHTGYAAYIAIYADWNNNGTYQLSELCGSTAYLPLGTGSITYSFTIPTTGVTVGIPLHLRVFLGESGSSGSVAAPCSASYGQTNDYYIQVGCLLSGVHVTPTTGTMCAGGTGIALSATGAGTGGTYSWNPTTGLSSPTGSDVIAAPAVTTTYTVTGTDLTGCVGYDSAVITVNPLPSTTITPASPAICAGGSVTLNAPVAAGYTYQWYNGATAIPGATNSTYLAFPASTTTYSVQVTSPAGCSATSAATTVTVNPLPPAVITPSGPLAICPGSTVSLSAGTGIGYTYQWYDASGAISGATLPTYTTGTAGDYSVRVTTASSCSSTSSTATVTINPVPVATITVSGATTFCANDSVTLTANSGTGYTYQWSNTGGLIPGATNINYTAHTAGIYNVTVTNGYGCSTTSTDNINVVINPLPVTTITAAGATTVCYPNTVTISATGGTGLTFQWYNGSAAIPAATNASYTATATGNYIVNIVNTVTGCTASTAPSAAVSVTVRPRPSAAITASVPITRFCSYDSITLSGTTGTGLSYQWLTSGVPITGATSYAYAVHNSGHYKLVVFNGICYDTTTTAYTDTVDPAPSATINTSGPVAFCDGSSVVLSATTGAGYTYQWYQSPILTGGTAISGATASTYTADTTGYYHAVITSPQGCVTSSSVIRVLAVPLPVITAGGPLAFCDGVNVVLSVTPVSGAVYQWKRNGTNIPGAVSASYIATSTGDYTCFVNVPGVCASTSAAIHVEVYPSPHPVITFDGATLRTYGYYTAYQWYINTVTIPGATSNTFGAYTNASYRVMVTDTNGCTRLSDEYQIFNLGVDNMNTQNMISIFPNPTTGNVHITGKPANSTVRVMSIEGKTVLSTSNEDIDISDLASGMYMIEITDDQMRRLYTAKVVKQ